MASTGTPLDNFMTQSVIPGIGAETSATISPDISGEPAANTAATVLNTSSIPGPRQDTLSAGVAPIVGPSHDSVPMANKVLNTTPLANVSIDNIANPYLLKSNLSVSDATIIGKQLWTLRFPADIHSDPNFARVLKYIMQTHNYERYKVAFDFIVSCPPTSVGRLVAIAQPFGNSVRTIQNPTGFRSLNSINMLPHVYLDLNGNAKYTLSVPFTEIFTSIVDPNYAYTIINLLVFNPLRNPPGVTSAPQVTIMLRFEEILISVRTLDTVLPKDDDITPLIQNLSREDLEDFAFSSTASMRKFVEITRLMFTDLRPKTIHIAAYLKDSIAHKGYSFSTVNGKFYLANASIASGLNGATRRILDYLFSPHDLRVVEDSEGVRIEPRISAAEKDLSQVTHVDEIGILASALVDTVVSVPPKLETTAKTSKNVKNVFLPAITKQCPYCHTTVELNKGQKLAQHVLECKKRRGFDLTTSDNVKKASCCVCQKEVLRGPPMAKHLLEEHGIQPSKNEIVKVCDVCDNRVYGRNSCCFRKHVFCCHELHHFPAGTTLSTVHTCGRVVDTSSVIKDVVDLIEPAASVVEAIAGIGETLFDKPRDRVSDPTDLSSTDIGQSTYSLGASKRDTFDVSERASDGPVYADNSVSIYAIPCRVKTHTISVGGDPTLPWLQIPLTPMLVEAITEAADIVHHTTPLSAAGLQSLMWKGDLKVTLDFVVNPFVRFAAGVAFIPVGHGYVENPTLEELHQLKVQELVLGTDNNAWTAKIPYNSNRIAIPTGPLTTTDSVVSDSIGKLVIFPVNPLVTSANSPNDIDLNVWLYSDNIQFVGPKAIPLEYSYYDERGIVANGVPDGAPVPFINRTIDTAAAPGATGINLVPTNSDFTLLDQIQPTPPLANSSRGVTPYMICNRPEKVVGFNAPMTTNADLTVAYGPCAGGFNQKFAQSNFAFRSGAINYKVLIANGVSANIRYNFSYIPYLAAGFGAFTFAIPHTYSNVASTTPAALVVARAYGFNNNWHPSDSSGSTRNFACPPYVVTAEQCVNLKSEQEIDQLGARYIGGMALTATTGSADAGDVAKGEIYAYYDDDMKLSFPMPPLLVRSAAPPPPRKDFRCIVDNSFLAIGDVYVKDLTQDGDVESNPGPVLSPMFETSRNFFLKIASGEIPSNLVQWVKDMVASGANFLSSTIANLTRSMEEFVTTSFVKVVSRSLGREMTMDEVKFKIKNLLTIVLSLLSLGFVVKALRDYFLGNITLEYVVMSIALLGSVAVVNMDILSKVRDYLSGPVDTMDNDSKIRIAATLTTLLIATLSTVCASKISTSALFKLVTSKLAMASALTFLGLITLVVTETMRTWFDSENLKTQAENWVRTNHTKFIEISEEFSRRKTQGALMINQLIHTPPPAGPVYKRFLDPKGNIISNRDFVKYSSKFCIEAKPYFDILNRPVASNFCKAVIELQESLSQEFAKNYGFDPPIYYISGASRSGKSFLTRSFILPDFVQKMRYCDLADCQEEIYGLPVNGDRYMSGYSGQRVGYLDDAFKMDGEGKMNDTALLFNLATKNGNDMNMAKVEEKGMSSQFELIAATSNTYKMENFQLTHPDALTNRLQCYHIEIISKEARINPAVSSTSAQLNVSYVNERIKRATKNPNALWSDVFSVLDTIFAFRPYKFTNNAPQFGNRISVSELCEIMENDVLNRKHNDDVMRNKIHTLPTNTEQIPQPTPIVVDYSRFPDQFFDCKSEQNSHSGLSLPPEEPDDGVPLGAEAATTETALKETMLTELEPGPPPDYANVLKNTLPTETLDTENLPDENQQAGSEFSSESKESLSDRTYFHFEYGRRTISWRALLFQPWGKVKMKLANVTRIKLNELHVRDFGEPSHETAMIDIAPNGGTFRVEKYKEKNSYCSECSKIVKDANHYAAHHCTRCTRCSVMVPNNHYVQHHNYHCEYVKNRCRKCRTLGHVSADCPKNDKPPNTFVHNTNDTGITDNIHITTSAMAIFAGLGTYFVLSQKEKARFDKINSPDNTYLVLNDFPETSNPFTLTLETAKERLREQADFEDGFEVDDFEQDLRIITENTNCFSSTRDDPVILRWLEELARQRTTATMEKSVCVFALLRKAVDVQEVPLWACARYSNSIRAAREMVEESTRSQKWVTGWKWNTFSALISIFVGFITLMVGYSLNKPKKGGEDEVRDERRERFVRLRLDEVVDTTGDHPSVDGAGYVKQMAGQAKGKILGRQLRDTNQSEQKFASTINNSFSIRRYTEGREHTGFGQFLDNETIMTNLHLLRDVGPTFFIRRDPTDTTGKNDIVVNTRGYVSLLPERDLVVIRVPTVGGVRSFRGECIMEFPPDGKEMDVTVLNCYGKQQYSTVLIPARYKSGAGEHRITVTGIAADSHGTTDIGRPGDCGSILVCSRTGAWIGVQSATSFSDHRVVYATWTTKMIEDAVKDIVGGKSLIVDDLAYVPNQGIKDPLPVFGVAPIANNMPKGTAYVRSRQPDWLLPEDESGITVKDTEALRKALSKYSNKQHTYPSRSVVEGVRKLYLERYPRPRKKMTNDMTLEDAMNQVGFLAPIDVATSAGATGEVKMKKSQYIDVDEKTGRRTFSEFAYKSGFVEKTEAALMEMKKGKRVAFVWDAALKDEKTTVEKIEAKKTRLFVVPPLAQLIIARFLIGEAIGWYQEQGLEYSHFIGLDKERDWGKLARYITFGNTEDDCVFDVDVKCYDGDLGPHLTDMIFWYLNGFYDNEWDLARKALFLDMQASIMRVGKKLYWKVSGQNSGVVGTSASNSMAHTYMLLTCIVINYLKRYNVFPSVDFLKNIRFVVYGDDQLSAYHSVAEKVFNPQLVAETFKMFGLDVTNATDKSKPIPANTTTLENVSFLSSSFRCEKNTWYSPYHERVLSKIVKWDSKTTYYDPEQRKEKFWQLAMYVAHLEEGARKKWLRRFPKYAEHDPALRGIPYQELGNPKRVAEVQFGL